MKRLSFNTRQKSNKHFIIEAQSAGWSMAPLIKDGGLLRVEIQHKNLHTGDIVLFLNKNKTTAHRIIHITKREKQILYITKGDNNSYTDDPVLPLQIIGRITDIKNPTYTIHLSTPRQRLIQRLFTGYSIINLYLPGLRNIQWLRRVKFLKYLYDYLLQR